MYLAIQWAAIVGIALVGTYLIRAYIRWDSARLEIKARLDEIRNHRYDWRIIENSWKREI